MNTKNHTLNASRSGFYLKALPSAILAACLFPAVASSANLLVGADNTDSAYDIGSFEKTTLAPGVVSAHYPTGSTAIKGWTVDVGALAMDITANANIGGFITPDPKQMADLADIGGFGRTITSVPVTVIPGQRYRLSFIIGNHLVYRSTVGVSMTGGRWSDDAPSATTAAKKTFLSAVSLGTPVNDWRTVTVDFIATSATTQITFSGEDPSIQGFPRQVAGFPLTSTLGSLLLPVESPATTTPSANPDAYAYPTEIANKPIATTLALAYLGVSENPFGTAVIPRINFDENITLDKVSLDLVPTTSNLVVNGSFEDTPVGSYAPFASLTNWTVGINGPIDATSAGSSGNAAKASDGTKYIDLAGPGGFDKGVTSDEITVEAGKRYTLSFDIGSYAENFSTVLVGMTDGTWADTNTSSDSFANINNAKLFFNHVKPIGTDSTNWQTVTVTWVAGTTGKTKISIVGVDPSNNAKLVLGTKTITTVTGGAVSGGTLTTSLNATGAVPGMTVNSGTITGGTTTLDTTGKIATTTGAGVTITGTVVVVGETTTSVYVGGTVTLGAAGQIVAVTSPLTNTAIPNVTGEYAQNYSANILLDNVKLQEEFADRVAYTGDFDGDGKDDVLWRNFTSGEVYYFKMNGAHYTKVPVSTLVATADWQIKGVGNFNGDVKTNASRDKKADILWRNIKTGQTQIALTDGATADISTPVLNLAAEVAGIGDFNSDGKSDILWRNKSNSNTTVFLMNGSTVIQSGPISTTVTNPQAEVVGTGDYDGNNSADILWRNNFTGNTTLFLMNGSTVTQSGPLGTAVPNLNAYVVGSGDFNGDGKSDILWRNKTNANTTVFLMNGSNVIISGPVGIPVPNLAAQVIGTGDHNGDGKSDILWRNAANDNTTVFLLDAAGTVLGSSPLVTP